MAEGRRQCAELFICVGLLVAVCGMGCAPLRPTSSRRAVCTHRPHAPSLLAGQTPLHWASAAGAHAAVQELIQTGSSTAARNVAGLTPLHWASGFGCKQAARDLLGAGSERGVKDIKGRTPADLAARAIAAER